MPSLFEDTSEHLPLDENLGPGTAILRGFATAVDTSMIEALFAVAAKSPFRHMVTPGGFRMSVAMTNCGPLGWVTDRKGYRYTSTDPETGSAGINRHIVGDERALRKRRSESIPASSLACDLARDHSEA